MDRELQALMKGPLAPLYCCFGDPVVGNPTQYMMERAFRAMSRPDRYLTIPVRATGLGEAMAALKVLGFAGANITTPHKREVLRYLDVLTDSACLCGAVNCITRLDDGRYEGDNTDGKGFVSSLMAVHPDLGGADVLLFGSGGAAQAIAVELVLKHVGRLVIVNRTQKRAMEMATQLEGISETRIEVLPWNGIHRIEATVDIVVQATSVGLFDGKAGIPVAFPEYCGTMVACDVVFNPVQTRFLRDAEAHGCRCLDGLGMLVEQGSIAVRKWCGRQPDLSVMREALNRAFSC